MPLSMCVYVINCHGYMVVKPIDNYDILNLKVRIERVRFFKLFLLLLFITLIKNIKAVFEKF